ncbi:lantibiotic ABC transporter permease [Paenibacillus albidus]|uniref:Lantibiotic ABC transporter permease n=1 Tax=Paenibacillus albidus TaxID=2041023 RepID=A0A917FBL6_9BACL|nr:ABC transporter permease [Paenibacillus albidus]GGF62472.1 lantibiotic ABC transporter permease [Paenibacillus albidus]
MLSLVRCEFLKLKRKKFILFVILAACLFPIPFTLLVLKGSLGSIGAYDGLFGLIITYGAPLMLPVIIGIVAAMLFFMERDNDTLKNLRTIPVSSARIATAKLIVLFIFGFIFSMASVGSSMVSGLLVGGINDIFIKLGISALTGLLLTAGTLPVIIAIVYFNRSYVFSILVVVFYAIFNFGMTMLGMTSTSPVMRLLGNILPAPIIYRWQMNFFVTPEDSFYSIISPYILPLPVVAVTICIIALLSYAVIVLVYRKRES